MNIRRGKLKDAGAIFNLMKNVYELRVTKKDDDDPFVSKLFIKEYLLDKKMNYVIVAEENRKIIGFLLAEIWKKKKYSFAAEIMVSAKYRKKGIAEKLFHKYEKYCKKNKLKVIVAQVQIKNKKAIKFSEKVGFKKGETFYYHKKEI